MTAAEVGRSGGESHTDKGERGVGGARPHSHTRVGVAEEPARPCPHCAYPVPFAMGSSRIICPRCAI